MRSVLRGWVGGTMNGKHGKRPLRRYQVPRRRNGADRGARKAKAKARAEAKQQRLLELERAEGYA